jgi:hypothetical protein
MSFQYLPEQQQKPKEPDQSFLILAGLGVVVVLGAVVLVGAFFLAPKGPTAPQPTVSPDIPTAREAYIPAVTAIREKDGGAVLMAAMGAWTPVVNRAELGAGRTGWTFYFYLPSSAQMAAVVVNRGGGARISEVKAWGTVPDALDELNWQIDSGASINKFTEKCLGSLNSDASVLATFSTARENNSLMWIYQAVNWDGAVLCEAKVDAQSGAAR